MGNSSAIEWLSLILGGAHEIAGIIAEFNRNGNAAPTLDEVMAAAQSAGGAHADFQAALAQLRSHPPQS